jgi:hypothetical protein
VSHIPSIITVSGVVRLGTTLWAIARRRG